MVSLMESATLAVAFVVFVIALTVGGQVLGSVQGTQFTVVTNNTLAACQANPAWANCSTVASNATAAGLQGIANFSGQASTIGTILGAVIILGLLMGAFLYQRQE